MEKQMCKPSGMLRSTPRLSAGRKPALMLSAMLGLTLLTGCVTTSSTEIAAQCSAWRSIYYSASKDTQATIRQILVHNRTGKNLGCW